MVKHSTNINKTNNHLSLNIKKTSGLILGHVYKCGGIKPANGIPIPYLLMCGSTMTTHIFIFTQKDDRHIKE
jgi:hypothetical protein